MAIAATALFAACSSDDDVLANVDENQEITIIAKLPQEVTTRVSYVDESEGSTYSVKPSWQEGDQVKVTYSESSYKSGNYGVNTSTGVITNFSKNPDNNTYVYLGYPLSSVNSNNNFGFSVSESTVTWSPKNQNKLIFSELSNLTERNLMLGSFKYTQASDKEQVVNFENQYALLKFCVKLKAGDSRTTLTEVTFGNLNDAGTGLGNTIISGTLVSNASGGFDWNKSDPSASGLTTGSGASFPLSGADASGYKEAIFYALVIPQTFDKGLYLEVKDGGSRFTYKATGSQELKAGYMYGIKAKAEK